MVVPAEFQYESCTCSGGMRNGQRCADCKGRGIVRIGTVISGKGMDEPVDKLDELIEAANDAAEEAEDDGLDQLTLAELREKAKDAGLPAGGTKAQIAARIRSGDETE